MWPLIAIVVLAAIIAGFVVWAMKSSGDTEGQIVGIVCFGFALLVVLIIWPVSYFGGIGEIASMRAFYHNTLGAYEYTVSATQEVQINASQAGMIDVAYMEQGKAVSERIKELRDKVEWFNDRLERYKTYNSNWFFANAVADTPPDLKPITIGK